MTVRLRHARRRAPARSRAAPSPARSGTIANGADASVEIKVRPQDGGHDHEPGNASRSDSATRTRPTTRPAPTTTVDPVADLSLTKADSPDPVLAGELLTYILTAQNAGPSSATGVELTDTLPAGVDLRLRHAHRRAAAPRRAARSPARSARSPTRPAARASRSRSARSTPGTITNQAGVASDDQRPGPRRTTPRAPRPPSTPAADLSLTKTRLARPGAGGRAAHLHPDGAQRRARRRHRRDAHRHAARRA